MGPDHIELYGSSALDYWRSTEGARLKRAEDPPEVDRLRWGRKTRTTMALAVVDACDRLNLTYPLHISVPDASLRRPSTAAVCHVWRELPGFKPHRTRFRSVLVPPPEVALLQVAASSDYIDVLLLMLEFLGCYLLSPDDEWGFIDIQKPLVTLEDLQRVLDAVGDRRLPGKRTFEKALRLATEGSKSPAESKLFVLYRLERRAGGFGFSDAELNPTVALDQHARLNLDLEQIRPDIHIPQACSALEYQSRLHPVESRSADDKRADALAAMGIRTFQLDRLRVRDLRDLSGVAHAMAQRAGWRRARPSARTLERREWLHRRLFLSQ